MSIDLSQLPHRVSARGGAALITQHKFPVSPRSLERWAVWKSRILVNGRNTVETAALLAEADARLAAAPPPTSPSPSGPSVR
jgi:hypothetical protein